MGDALGFQIGEMTGHIRIRIDNKHQLLQSGKNDGDTQATRRYVWENHPGDENIPLKLLATVPCSG
jgi:hypothetical protein